jgi:predicted transcriptional regulator
MKQESLVDKESVYRAMFTEYKTLSELRNELKMSDRVVQNHLQFLLSNKLIKKRQEKLDKPGVTFAYTACDSSDVYTFEEKLRFNKDKTPVVIGRCDFAASWVPKQTNYYEETV